jgi:hypothetical protein
MSDGERLGGDHDVGGGEERAYEDQLAIDAFFFGAEEDAVGAVHGGNGADFALIGSADRGEAEAVAGVAGAGEAHAGIAAAAEGLDGGVFACGGSFEDDEVGIVGEGVGQVDFGYTGVVPENSEEAFFAGEVFTGEHREEAFAGVRLGGMD